MTSAEEAARAALEDIHWGDGEENIKKITALILSREAEARKQEKEALNNEIGKYLLNYTSKMVPTASQDEITGFYEAWSVVKRAIRARSGA